MVNRVVLVGNLTKAIDLQKECAGLSTSGAAYKIASTDGKDLPANLTFPNVKIQSNFTFSMASTGDPSTFTFTMDAFPGYTYFDKTKKVLCAIQIVDDKTDRSASRKSIFAHKSTPTTIEESQNDSSPDIFNESTSQWENSIEG